MSTLLDLLKPALEPEIFEAPAPGPETPATRGHAPWNHARFEDEQMRLLVRQIFLPGWQKPPRHVAFSAVDESTYVAEICRDVGRILSTQISGNVCLIEANAHNPELESVFGR